MTWSDLNVVDGQNCALEFVGKQYRKYEIVAGSQDNFHALFVHAHFQTGFCPSIVSLQVISGSHW